MAEVWVHEKSFASPQDVIRTPCPVHRPAKLWYQVHTLFDLRERDNRGSVTIPSSGMQHLIHAQVGQWSIEGSELLDICEWVFECTKCLGEAKNDADLTD